MTVDERRAELLAGGLRAPEVEELLAAELVDGVLCDGTVVIDESGRRCVTRAQADRVRRARESDPLVETPPRANVIMGAVAVGVVVLLLGTLIAIER